MAKSDGEKSKGKAAGKEPGKGSGVIARFFACVVLVVLLAYISCGVALSFEPVRRAVCDRIGMRLGVHVEADASHLGLPFAVVLENVKTEGYEDGAGGLMFQRLRISPDFGGGWNVSCESGSMRLACGRDDVWSPSGLAALGPVSESDLSQVSVFTSEFCSRTTLTVSGLTIRWVHADGEVAAAGGVSFVVRQAKLADRPMLYHALEAASVVGPGGARASEVRREWLSGEGMPYRQVVREGGEVTGKGVFWEGTKQ